MNKLHSAFENEWVRVNHNLIEKIKRQCVDCHMRGSFNKELDLGLIIKLFASMQFELNKTSKELRESKQEFENYKNESNKLIESLKIELNQVFKDIENDSEIVGE